MIAKDLVHCRLYGILDLGYVDALDVGKVAKKMIDGGVDLIQLRAKAHSLAEIAEISGELHRITYRGGIPLIVNDHSEIARIAGSEGVHVGQTDPAIREVRAVAGAQCIVGKSTHSFEQALQAVEEGADYIGFGPIFPTPTKPDYKPIGLGGIKRVHEAVPLPIFCIGGITLRNLPEIIAAGGRRVVIVSALLQAGDIAQYARSAKDLLKRNASL